MSLICPWSECISSFLFEVRSVRNNEHFVFVFVISINCYGLNVCVPPKFICWNLNSQGNALGGGAFGRWLSHEGGALTNGVSVLIKQTPQSSQPTVLCQDTKASLQPHRRTLTRIWSRWRPELGLSASKTWAINFCWLSASQSVEFCHSSADGQRHVCCMWHFYRCENCFIFIRKYTQYHPYWMNMLDSSKFSPGWKEIKKK